VTDRVRCIAATFPGSTSYDVNITLRAPFITTPTVYTVTATVTSDDEVNTANDSEIVKTTIVKGADLNLTKTSSPNPLISSGIATYRFEVGNNGPHQAIGLSFTDTLPVGLTFVADNASPSSDDDASWNCTAVGQDITCSGPDINVTNSSIFSFRVQATTSSVGDIINVATVVSDTLEVDHDNNIATDELNITAGTDMKITKTLTTPLVISDENVSFSLLVENNGFMDAEDINITDTLALGYTNVTASAIGWDCNVSANPIITCSRLASPIGAGVSETIIITATAPTVVAIESHQNNATVTTTTNDSNMSNNSDDVTYTVSVSQADLGITKSKSPTPIAVGQNATSTIVVSNSGPKSATPVQVVDDLSPKESYVSSSGTDWNCTHDGSLLGGVVVCDYNQVLNVGSNTATLTIITLAEAEGNLTNTACTGGSMIGGTLSVEPLEGDRRR